MRCRWRGWTGRDASVSIESRGSNIEDGEDWCALVHTQEESNHHQYVQGPQMLRVEVWLHKAIQAVVASSLQPRVFAT